MACLEPGASTRTYLLPAIGGVFAVVGLGVAVGGLIGGRKNGDDFGEWS